MERERDIESWIRVRIVDMGGLFWKITSPGNAGVPDRLVILPGGGLTFMEIKTADGELSEIQEYQIAQLQKRRIPVVVIYGMEQALEYVRILRKLTPVLQMKGRRGFYNKGGDAE